jgi:hypothetical protein
VDDPTRKALERSAKRSLVSKADDDHLLCAGGVGGEPPRGRRARCAYQLAQENQERGAEQRARTKRECQSHGRR